MTIKTTDDAVLGGRLRLVQPKRGHRVGHDAILLAAATEAHDGERAIDLGSGVGAAGLALAHRVPGLTVDLVEIDSDLCVLAADNARRNGLEARVRAIVADVTEAQSLSTAGIVTGTADRVLMNPPFNDPRVHRLSPDTRRRRAHAGDRTLLDSWSAAGHRLLKPAGVLTLIWRADARAEVIATLAARFGSMEIMPVLPRADAAAIRVLVRALKDAPLATRDCAPLVLNDAAGKPTREAEAVLRGAEPLLFSEKS
jgi:tRNA1(Val) A37 N6-methylase TrmN6